MTVGGAREGSPTALSTPETPLSVISPEARSKTIRRAACGVTSRILDTMPADTDGLAMTSSTSPAVLTTLAAR